MRREEERELLAGWCNGAMVISSALNLASSLCVIFVTRMVLTATSFSPRSEALKTVPNLRPRYL